MSEEIESGAGVEDALPGTDPAAMAMALNGASREEADDFLKKQSSLIDIQKHHLREQFKHLSLTLWEKRMGVALKVATFFMGLAVAAGLSLVVWQAVHSDGLVIESFSAPPDMEARGLNGQVIAGQFSDKLSALQKATDSGRAARTYSNNWGNDIKVEIPDTGVSVGEAFRLLKSWLGNETHVSGDIWRTDTGIAVTARVSESGGGAVFTGTESELDSLIQKAAEDVYGRTQPYRYAAYLLVKPGLRDEGLARLKTLATTGDASDRGWAYMQWSNALTDSGSNPERELLYGLAQQYGVAPAAFNQGNIESALSHPEQALPLWHKGETMLRENGGNGFDPQRLPAQIRFYQAAQLAALGAYSEAAQATSDAIEGGVRVNGNAYATVARAQINAHDLTGARKSFQNPYNSQAYSPIATELGQLGNNMLFAAAAEDWPAVLVSAQARDAIYQKNSALASSSPTAYLPQAHAEAMLGNFGEAEARVKNTPADCYECLRMRGQIAALQGQNARADWWFERAVKAAPSIPFAYFEWGQALMDRRDPAGAIAKFTLANQKGPHFADPLEGWGEALVAQNRSDLALAKFTEAEKYAPNWGRLHLKWGEALFYAGKKDDAQKQFALAATLNLTAAEKAELARMTPHGR